MINTKLVNVLRTFSKNELKEFEKLVSSPYFNRGRNYMPFLAELKKFYPKFDDEKLTPEHIYSKLYPGKKFNKQIMWNASSTLLNIAEEYMVLKALGRNKFERNHMLAEEYHARKLTKSLGKTIDEIERKIGHLGIEDEYFLFKTKIAVLRKAHNFLEDSQHLNIDQDLKKGEYTILHFLKNMAGVVGDLKVHSVYFNKNYEVNLPEEFLRNINLDKIIAYAKEKNFCYAWIMEMYYHLMMLILDFDNTDHFFRLKTLFLENYDKFRHELKYNWIIPLTNYCIMKNEQGIDFKRYLFEMNELNLKTGIVFPGKYLTKIVYLRILRNALSVNETEWAKKYIQEYAPKLKPSHQKPLLAFSYASLHFQLKDYKKVLENLLKVEFIDGRDKLYAKTLYIRTHYELNDVETVLLHLDSTRKFVNNNSHISEQTKKNCIDFLNAVGRLVNIKVKEKYSESDDVLHILQKNNGIENADWLFEKAQELIKK